MSKKNIEFIGFQKYAFAALLAISLLLLLLGHRYINFLSGGQFLPDSFANQASFIVTIILVLIVVLPCLCYFIVRYFERDIRRNLNTSTKAIYGIGKTALRNGVFLVLLAIVSGGVIITIDKSLLNPWDILFYAIFVGLFYIGTFIHFYYGITIRYWATSDKDIEIEKVKIEYNEQRMWLRVFIGITISFLVGQVFVALKIKFAPYFEDPVRNAAMIPIMAINGLQIVFLIMAMWVLVFSQIIRRMEQVKQRLWELGNISSEMIPAKNEK